jgi:L-malate glycosyltransferase
VSCRPDPPQRVLFYSHTAAISGAERSLLDLLGALPQGTQAVIACPEGPLADAASSRGYEVRLVPGTAGSLRLHPLHTSRALVELARAGTTLRSLASKGRFELIHANSVRAGISSGLARRLGGPPVIVHVRDALPSRISARAAARFASHYADAVIANSMYTQRGLAAAGVAAEVVHSPVDVREVARRRMDRAQARRRLGLDSGANVLAVVGQITPWKGQADAIEALALLADADATLLVVGEAKFVDAATRFDNRAYARMLHDLARDRAVADRVVFTGHREDVPEVLSAVDLVLVPSWEEPFGRVVVEAMAAGAVVVATSVGGPREIVRDGVDGILLPPRNPQLWSTEVDRLLALPARRAALAANARSRALLFSPEAHTEQVYRIYEGALGRSAKRLPRRR